MQKDEIKIGDTVRIVKVGSNLPQNMLNKEYRVTYVFDGIVDFIDENDVEWCGYIDVKYFNIKHSFHVQKVESEKPFRMPTTAIRMYHKGQWKNCSSDDVELTWDHF